MIRSTSAFLVLFTVWSSAMHAAEAEKLTYPDLVHRLYDLEHLAVPPPVGEQTALASSYDRSSIYDAASDSYHHWDANGDFGGIVRKEGDADVLMDVQGPGCIWRTWSARPQSGHVKIYLDGDSTPAVDLSFTGYFDGTSVPFTRPNLVYQTPQIGWDNFTPIPFSRSCKIVADKGWGMFYHFNYTRFAPGTMVPTFKLPLSATDSAALDEANKIMGNLGTNPVGARSGEETQKADLTIAPGEKATVADLAGSGAITALKVKFPLPTDPEAQKNLLRQLVVRITWDEAKEPAVWSPLGDFFADAVVPVKYRNLVTGIADDGQWYTYWYMPYSSHAQVEVQNESGNPITMNWEVTHAPLTKAVAATLLRFHAKWHRDAFLPERKDRAPDWTLLATQGMGRYVGTQLHVWNPRGGWWGEGDEKFFVDGEKFPSSFGTGSEDYFGFAWSSGTAFHKPLHGQPYGMSNEGSASLYRWHIADDIPFQTGFEGAIEKYYPNSRPTLYAAVAFWYLAPGGKDAYPEVPVADRIGYWAAPPPPTFPANMITPATDTSEATPAPDPEIIEGESMKPKLGDAEIVVMTGFGKQWSNQGQLFWRPARIGSYGENEFQTPKAGKYRLSARFTQARDYGITQLSVNGTNVGPPLDLHAENVKPTVPVDLGTVELKDGTNILGMEMVGSRNDGYNFGLDYIKLVPVP